MYYTVINCILFPERCLNSPHQDSSHRRGFSLFYAQRKAEERISAAWDSRKIDALQDENIIFQKSVMDGQRIIPYLSTER